MHSLFLNPQSGVGPSISSSVVQCSVFLLVCISVPILAVYFCPPSVSSVLSQKESTLKETGVVIVQNLINHFKKIIPVIFGTPSYTESVKNKTEVLSR